MCVTVAFPYSLGRGVTGWYQSLGSYIFSTSITNKVKESKISVLVHRFELFKIKENETIAEMVTRFTDITNSLVALGKTYTQVEMTRKVLQALTREWERRPLL